MIKNLSESQKRPLLHPHVPKAVLYFNREASDKNFTLTGPILGGRDEFFKHGSKILDIGAGGGKAVHEMTEKFKEIQAIGIDIRYGDQPPEHKEPFLPNKAYVCADWTRMPFKDNSFDRLLSYESFPRYPFSQTGSDDTDINKTFREITRIAQVGAIWRGTLGSWVDISPTDFFTQNGWEVYTFNKRFIARLITKNNQK